MKAEFLLAASKVIPNQQILINMVSQRVRQLSNGHRPLVPHAIGLLSADIALTEIAQHKLTFESTLGEKEELLEKVVTFPVGVSDKKKKAA